MVIANWLEGTYRTLLGRIRKLQVRPGSGRSRPRRAAARGALAARLEHLEERALLTSILWDGDAGDNLWTTASNWSGNVVPGVNDDVTINIAGSNTISLTSGNVSIRSLQSQENLVVNGATLRVTTGASDVTGSLTLTNATLTVEGATADFEATGATTLTGSSLFARSGGHLSLPAATAFDAGSTAGDKTIQVETNGVINLPNVTSFNTNTAGYTIFLRASGGADIDLSGLTSITNNAVSVYAQDAGSTIDLSALTSWTGHTTFGGRVSDIEFRPGATVDVSSLATLVDTTVTVNGVEISLPALTDVTGSSFFARNSGILHLPAVTTLHGGTTAGDRVLQGETGGTLDLPNVTSITSNTLGYTTSFRAFDGASVLLPGLTSISDNSVNVYTEDSGSLIDLSGVVTWNGRSSVSGRTSTIESRVGSTIDISSMTTLIDSTIVVNDYELTLPTLSDITGSSVYVRGTAGILHLPAVTTYNSGITAGDRVFQGENGGTLDLSNLTALTQNSQGYTTYFRTFDGSDILLSGLTSITNCSVNVYSEDANSRIDLSNLVTWSGRSPVSNRTSDLGMAFGGTVDVSKLTTLVDATITVTGSSITLPLLSDLTGSSLVVRNATGELHLPALTTYNAGITAGDRLFQAETGGLLDLSHVTSLVSTPQGYTTYIRAFDGSEVVLSGLTAINDNSVSVYAEDAGSHIDLSGLVTWNGRSPVSSRRSSVDIRAGSTIDVGATLDTTQVDFSFADGVTVDLNLTLGTGSTLNGSGTVVGNVVNNLGTVNPGFEGSGLSINGDYTQAATASLIIDVNGVTNDFQIDRLHVSGVAHLAGTLKIQGTNPLLIPPGKTTQIVTYASATGNFGTITGTDLGSGVQTLVTQNTQNITLKTTTQIVPISSAASPDLPTAAGDGVHIDLFNAFGGGNAPTPASLVGKVPSGETLSPVIDFPNPGFTINVGTSFDNFFSNTTTPPDEVQGLTASNFTLRANFFLRVSPDLDMIPETPEIDLQLGVGSDDGYYLVAGDQFLGSTGDRGFTYTYRWVSFESSGMYPVQLLFAANAIGQSGLELSWVTATSNGAKIIPQSVMYVNPEVGDRSVTFEEVPAGTVVTDQYRNLGLIFTNISGNLQATSANPGQFVPVSPTRVYADPNANPAQQGKVSASFVLPGTNTAATTNFVSFYVIDAETTGATVKAFDPQGNVIFNQDYHGGGGTQERVTIIHPQIARVEITLGQGADTAAIDNFNFNEPVSQPDLVVEDVVPASTNVHFGDSLDLSWVTRNIGIGNVPTGWTEKVWLSTDQTLDAGDLLVSTRPSGVSSLASLGVLNVNTTISLPQTGTEGTYYLIVQTDSQDQVTELSELNTAVSAPITVTLTPLPDLSPSDVVASVTTAHPGDKIHVTWKTLTANGQPFVGTVVEQVYLSDDSVIGGDRLVGTFTYENSGASFPRDVEITIPDFGVGSGGTIRVVVRTDVNATVVESDENNNAAISAASINIPLQLAVSIVPNQVDEDGTAPQVLVTRTGSTANALTVTLASNNTNEATVPLTVVIPAGQSGATVDLTPVHDQVLDGDKLVTITATANGFISASDNVTILDIDVGDLTLNIPSASMTEGQSQTATITRSFVSNQALVVTLVNSNGSQVGVPTTVIIPANQASATFTIQAFENSTPEQVASVSITASATDYHSAVGNVQVVDNDLPTLTLSLNHSTINEGAGIGALQATVSRAVATNEALAIAVSIAGTSKLLAPTTVTIPANQLSVTFSINVLDDQANNGDETATISVAALYPADNLPILTGQDSKQVVIQDNDGPTLTVVLDHHFVGEGLSVAAIGTVTRNTSSAQALVVTLISSDTTEATVPAQVTIPAGATSVTFNVTTLADGIADGTQNLTITASANGFTSGSDALAVSDVDLPDLVISNLAIPANAITDAFTDITFEVQNTGRKDAAGTITQRLLLSTDPFLGDDVILGNYTFTGILKDTAPLDHFSQTVSVQMPHVDGDYWIIAIADANNAILEGLENNNVQISATPIHLQPAYTATVQTSVTTALVNTPIPLTGTATAAITGLPAPFALVNIDIVVNGVKRTISAITDNSGQFSTTFTPLPGEGGNYTIAAYHPGSTAGAAQDQFSLIGMAADPAQSSVNVIEGMPGVSGDITIRNLSNVGMTGVIAQVISAPSNVVVDVELGDGSAGQSLVGLGTLNLHASISALDDSIANGTVVIRLTTAEGASLDVPIQVTVTSLRPHLIASTTNLVSGMLRGQQRLVEFTITNDGGLATGRISLQLPNVPWISSASGTTLPSILPGASAKVVIQLLPPADLPLGEYNGNLFLSATDTSLSLPFTFRNLSEAKGDLAIDVVDEYTFFADGSPHLAGAHVTLTDTLTGVVVATGTSDANGRLAIPALAEGYYDLRVEADQHVTFNQTILVEAGKQNEVQAFLSRQTVRYIWTVEPTEIQDRTRITVTSIFETNVPAPVVVVEGAIDLAEIPDDTDTAQYEIVIRNEGLIAVENVKISLPDHPDWTFTPLISSIGVLPARSSITIPIVVTRHYTTITATESLNLTAYEGLTEIDFATDPVADFLAQFGSQMGTLSAADLADVSQAVSLMAAEDAEINTFSQTASSFEAADAILDHLRELEGKMRAFAFGAFIYAKYSNIHWQYFLGRDGHNTGDPNSTVGTNDADPLPDYGVGTEVSDMAKNTPTFLRMFEAAVPDIRKAINDYVCAHSGPGKLPDHIDTEQMNFKKYGMDGQPLLSPGFFAATYDLYAAFGNMNDDKTGQMPYVEIEIKELTDGKDKCDKPVKKWKATLTFHQFDYYDFNQKEPQIELQEHGWASNFLTSITMDYDIEGDTYCDKPKKASGPCNVAGVVSYTFPCGGNDVPGSSPFPIYNAGCDCTQAPFSGGAAGVGFSGGSTGGNCAPALVTLAAQTASGPTSSDQIAAASGGVCAQVVLQISQDLVQTRDAFDANLDIVNISDGTLANVDVDIVISDQNGLDVTNLFVIRPAELTNINAIDGTGTVNPNTTGGIHWLIIPTTDAAPTGPVVYNVSGVMRYTDGGNNVTVQLAEVAITVLPTPLLQVHYFHQRDVISDDPFTPQVETAVPYNLGVMIENVGGGAARNLSITSAQPKIVENDKGLLIGFQILATEVQGQNLTPSLTANFGVINPGEIAQARWLLSSTLQGQFIDYAATFQNLDTFGDPRLSLIDSVDIHELIHLVTADGTFNDGKFDYLVNDVPDEHDTPDTLWLSDGSVVPVAEAADEETDGPVAPGDLEVNLTASVGAGWNYFELNDPSNGLYHLTHVFRTDGTEVPIGDNVFGGNAWQTDRTFIEHGQRPVLENKLHILDFGGDGHYTLVFAPNDVTAPTVASITGTTSVVTDPVDSLTVTFSKIINGDTLTAADLTLTLDGGATNLINASVTVTQLTGTTYRIDGLAGLTAADGSYHFTVDATGVGDLFGNQGAGLGEFDWTKAAAVPAVSSIDGIGTSPRNTAIDTISVTFTQPIDLDTLSVADLTLSLDGTPVSLSGASLVVSQTGLSTYSISGLGAFTSAEGNYTLTITGTGVTNPLGTAGIGAMSAAWEMDTTAPTIDSLTGLPSGATRFSVDFLDVLFSEAISATTLLGSDIHLTRNGVLVTTSGLTVTQLNPDEYRISGLTALTTAEGEYELSITGVSITDLAGNLGTGAASQSWTVDTTPPAPAHDLAFSPDTGIPNDGVTNAFSVNFTGVVDESGLTVDLFDLTTQQPLGAAALEGTLFAKAVNFTVVGNHQIRVRVTDAAGNFADREISVFIDQAPPVVDHFVGIPTSATTTVPNVIDIVFSEDIDATTLTLGDFTLIRDGGANLLTPAVSLTQVDGHTFRLSGLAGMTAPDGSYVLKVKLAGIFDLAGNQGTGESTAPWTRDTGVVQPATLRGTVFNDLNQNKVQDSGEGPLVNWTIFLDADQDGILDPGERSTTTNVNGEYVFDNLAPGTYVVSEILPEGWIQTFPSGSPLRTGGATSAIGASSSVTTVIDGISADPSDTSPTTGNGGFAWQDQDPSTPAVIDIFYDFRTQNGVANQITGIQQALAEQALSAWSAATGGKIHFVRNTTAAAADIINIGTGDLEAVGYVSGTRHTIGVGGGLFTQNGTDSTITNGVVWLDVAETWDNSYGNGEQSGAYDYFTVVSQEIGHALGITETLLDPTGSTLTVAEGSSDLLLFQTHCGCGGVPENGIKYMTEATTLSVNERSLVQSRYGTGGSTSSTVHSSFYTGTGVGYRWADQDPSTPDVIEVYYDFRSLNGYANQITSTQIALAEQAMSGWAFASAGRLRFVRNTTAAENDIINIGTGDLAALGGVSSTSGTLALGGGTFVSSGSQGLVTHGQVWLDKAEAWDMSYANGNPSGTFDYFSVVSHEIGHALGLGHTDGLPGPDIMDGSYAGEKTTFSANDQFLIRTLYASSAPANDQPGGSISAATVGGSHIVTVAANEVIDNLDFGNALIAVTVESIQIVSPHPGQPWINSIIITFSRPIDPSTFNLADLSLVRNGGGNLLSSQVEIRGSGTTYTLSGLKKATKPTGNYTLTVSAAGVEDTHGESGSGTASTSWQSGEQLNITDIQLNSPDVRDVAVDSIDVTFNTPIDPETFDLSDVVLTRKNTANLLTGNEAISLISGNTYRITGLGNITNINGRYDITINVHGVTGLNGFVGEGTTSKRWVLKHKKPKAATHKDQDRHQVSQSHKSKYDSHGL